MQNKKVPIQIKRGSITEAYALAEQIPEFREHYSRDEYFDRLKDALHLILIAHVADQPAGFKISYERQGMLYNWMGGVLPAYRRLGVAQALAERQEAWARQSGFKQVYCKTWNRHKAMLLFALNNGFDITEVQPRDQISDYRIILQKEL